MNPMRLGKKCPLKLMALNILLTAPNFQGIGFSMIERRQELNTIAKLLKSYPVVGIIGARQVGKTTLAQQFAAQNNAAATHYDLENPEDEARLADPMLALKQRSKPMPWHYWILLVSPTRRIAWPTAFPWVNARFWRLAVRWR